MNNTIPNILTANNFYGNSIGPIRMGPIPPMVPAKNTLPGMDGIGRVNEAKAEKASISESSDPESGWEFWGRVYEDPELRSQLNDRFQNTPTVSELLTSEKLVRAQLFFFNVPRIRAASQQVIRSLIEAECGKQIAIFDITISIRKWRVRFFREEDALEVLRAFDGYRFRNRFLAVRYDDMMNIKNVDLDKQLKKADRDTKPEDAMFEIPELFPIEKNNTWSKAEKLDFEMFKTELAIFLGLNCRSARGLSVSIIRDVLLLGTLAPVVKDALAIWPVGVFRMCCAPQICFTDEYLSGTHHQNTGLPQNSFERNLRSVVEPWEPMAPSLLRTNYHLMEYASALLREFGPQNLDLDLPWKIFASTLPCGFGWPQDSKDLMQLVANLSPKFGIFSGSLFLLDDPGHCSELACQIASIPS